MRRWTVPVDARTRRAFLKTGLATACAACLAGGGLGPGGVRAQAGMPGDVRPRPGAWFAAAPDGAVRCELCPWRCTLAAGQRARCRVRANHGGEGQTLAWGNPVLVQEDPVERLPFFHVRPGSRTLSVSTAGCNLHCQFCEVWDMALVHPEEVHSYDMPPSEIIEHARAAGLESVSFAFGEPVVFYEYMLEIAARARIREELGADVPLHLARFYPLCKLANLPQTPVAALDRARAICSCSKARNSTRYCAMILT
jgi:pyruvate formate lyase activating enzyme